MNRIALKGGLLIDGTGAAAVKDSLVLVDNGKITYAGPGKAVPKGYHITNISGKTVMPGLIDAHLHFPAISQTMTVIGCWKTIFRKRWWLYSSHMSAWKQV